VPRKNRISPVKIEDHVPEKWMPRFKSIRERLSKWKLKDRLSDILAVTMVTAERHGLNHDLSLPPGGRTVYVSIFGRSVPRIKIRLSDHSWTYRDHDLNVQVQNPYLEGLKRIIKQQATLESQSVGRERKGNE
jgi:hypothetical protein